MKKTLALVFAIVMVISSCLPVGAITLETVTDDVPVTVVETPAAEDTVLAEAIASPSTAVSPQYGKLVLYMDYEQENATSSSYAYLDPAVLDGTSITTASGFPNTVVDNPDTTIGGKVVDVTNNGYAYYVQKLDWDDAFAANGQFMITFDLYAADSDFNFAHQSWDGWGGDQAGGATIATTPNTWQTVVFKKPYKVSVDYSTNTYGTYTHEFGSKGVTVVEASASDKQPFYKSFGFVHTSGTSYLDNMKLWYYPNNAFVVNTNGVYSLVEFDASGDTFMLPAAEGVTGYTNGVEFFDVNYPVAVSKFYGKNITLTPTSEVLYDDNKGELAVALDFENVSNIHDAKLINGNYFSTSVYTTQYEAGYISKPTLVEDGENNHAIKQITADGTSYGFYQFSAKMDDSAIGIAGVGSVYSVDLKLKALKLADDYTVEKAYPAKGTFWFNGNGGGNSAYSISGINFDDYISVSHKHTVGGSATRLESWAFGIVPSTGYNNEYLVDDVAIYFFPSNKIHIKESASSSKVYALTADANGNVVVPTAEQLGLELEGVLTGYKAEDGTTLTVGETVATATYAAKTYYPVVEVYNATFVYGDESVVVNLGNGSSYAMPTLSQVKSEWADVERGSWMLDKTTAFDYGTVLDVAYAKDKTFTFIPTKVNTEYGKLVHLMDNTKLTDYNDVAIFRNGAYSQNGGGFFLYFSSGITLDTEKFPGETVGKQSGASSILRIVNAFTDKNAKYTVVLDAYTEEASRPNLDWARWTFDGISDVFSKNIDLTSNQWSTVATETITRTKNTDGTYTFASSTNSFVKGDAAIENFTFYYNYNYTKEPFYYKNVAVYYAPVTTFELDGVEVSYDLGNEATATLPAVSTVFPGEGDNYAWCIGDAVYNPGDTIEITDCINNNIVAVAKEYYVTFNGVKKTVAVSDITLDAQVLPEFTAIDATWINAKSYVIGGALYVPGDEVAVTVGDTYTVIDAEAFSVENGVLVSYLDFEQGNKDTNVYVNPDYSAALKIVTGDSGSTLTLGDKTNGSGSALEHSVSSNFFLYVNNAAGLAQKNGTLKLVFDSNVASAPGWCGWRTTHYGSIFGNNTAPLTKIVSDAVNNWNTYETVSITQTYADGTYTMTQPNKDTAKTDLTAPVGTFLFYNNGKIEGEFDNFRLFFYPTDRLFFAAEEGAEVVAKVAENGKVTVPTPAELGLDVVATHWVSADGVATLKFGQEVDVAAYAETVYYPVADVAPVADTVVDYNEIREGLRFKATVTQANKAVLEEYGFLFARDTILNGADLTFDFETEETVKAPYISAKAYDVSEGIDEAISVAENGDTTFAMTAFGIPEGSRDETLVARPYAKYFVNEDEVTVYGTQVTAVYNTVAAVAVQG